MGEEKNRKPYNIERLWNTEVVLPALNKLPNHDDEEPEKPKPANRYGKMYFHLDFDRADINLHDIVFNSTIRNSVSKLYADYVSTNSCHIKLRNDSGDTCFDMDFFERGGYGKLYVCKLNKNVICKMLRSREIGKTDYENCLFIEALIHSIISCDERKPRTCSKFLGIKLETLNLNSPLVFSEYMSGSVDKIEPKDVRLFTSVIEQMANALEYLQGKYKFIHGDLKLNNICYKKLGYRKYRFVMVDFGMSVMAYNSVAYSSMEISTNMFIRRGSLSNLQFPNSGDLSLLCASSYDYFECAVEPISYLLTFPYETEPLTKKINFTDNQKEIYSICYGCHNDRTLPNTIMEHILRRYDEATDFGFV